MHTPSASVGTSVPNVNALLRPLADQIVTALGEVGHSIGVQHAQQLLAAALGFYNYKMMLDAGPVIYREPPRPYSQRPATFTQLRRHYIEERVARLCETDEWRSRELADVVYGVVLDSKLRVDAQAAWARGDAGAAILAALGNSPDVPGLPPVAPPVNATVAIKKRLVDPLAYDQPLRAPAPRNGRPGLWGPCLSEVEGGGYRLWTWPGREPKPEEMRDDARSMIYADQYEPDPLDRPAGSPFQGSATLGLGLCLIKHRFHSLKNGEADEASIFFPFYVYSRPRDGKGGGWRVQWHSNGGWTNWPEGRLKLPMRTVHHLPAEYDDLPEVAFCRTCRQIHADVATGPFVHRCLM